eukprot:CAMPEP_0194533006 /NCGR_PEP_ID=MMETSP0253-20130528/70756_1 /TAXON_ID=2966 /ORGANISM="Noctiluca scintillans" /LENGTH=566 /DNA_ID=CAMNT_0039378515 /DNA_START=16 /DNA_END=1716 /DNA_ORIENTATION=+
MALVGYLDVTLWCFMCVCMWPKRHLDVFSWIRKKLVALSSIARRLWGPETDIDRKSRQLVEDGRVQSALDTIRIFGAVCFVYLSRNLVTMHSAGMWGDADIESLRFLLVDDLHIDLIFWTLSAMWLTVFKGASRSVDLVHSFFYGIVILHTWGYTDVVTFLWKSGQQALLRVITGVLFGNVTHVFCLNALCLGCEATRVLVSDELAEQGTLLILYSAFVSLAVVLGTAMHRSAIRRESRANVEILVASQSEKNTRELLRFLCDVVLDLDNTLHVHSGSPALAALLLQNPSKQMRGAAFEEVICRSDRDRFRSFMGGRVETQCIHVHLRDASGGRVPVQLFHTPYTNLFDQAHHLLGIREEIDGERSEDPAQDHRGTQEELPTSATLQLSDEVQGRADLVRACDDDECAVVVDVLSLEQRMSECTPSFSAISGPIRLEEGFLDWIIEDKGSWLRWVQTSVEELMEGRRPAKKHFRFAPPHMQEFMYFAADTSLCFPPEGSNSDPDLQDTSESNDDEEQLYVKIIFYGMKRVLRTHSPQRREYVKRTTNSNSVPSSLQRARGNSTNST